MSLPRPANSNFRMGNQFVQPARPSFAPATNRVTLPRVRYVSPPHVPTATRLARFVGRRAGPLGMIAMPWLLQTAQNQFSNIETPETLGVYTIRNNHKYIYGMFLSGFGPDPSFATKIYKGYSNLEQIRQPMTGVYRLDGQDFGPHWHKFLRYENNGRIGVYAYSGYKQRGEPMPKQTLSAAGGIEPNPFIRGDPRHHPQYRFFPDPAVGPVPAAQAVRFDFYPDGTLDHGPAPSPGRKPRRNVRETKAARRTVVAVVMALTNLASETAEVIDTLYFYARTARRDLEDPGVWRIPRGVDGGRWAKLMYILRHADSIDWSQALPHVLFEQLVIDKVIGRTIGAADNRFRDINDYSVSPQFGPLF
jgi:hypothetical protein